MLVIKTKKELSNQLFRAKKKDQKIGFVPTMGALHDGHLSLINQSKGKADLTVCSIFVNPTQFNDPNDFQQYPITIDNDILLLQRKNCDILFLPTVEEMYPDGIGQIEKFEFGFLAETLEGEFRPGHFNGMAHIVAQLLLAVEPDFLFMGQKDYQQAMIVRKMIEIKRLTTELIVCAIKREKDGLAMSSRNVRLNPSDRLIAKELSACLKKLKNKIDTNPQIDVPAIIKIGADYIAKYPSFEVEYIAWRDAVDLSPVNHIKHSQESVLLVAAWIGGVRLIDNLLIK